MKKLLALIIIVGVSAYLSLNYGCKNLFIPETVKRVKAVKTEVLIERALEAEKEIKNNAKSVSRAASAFEKLGKRYVKRMEWHLAIKYLIKALEYGADSSSIHYSIALAYANRGAELQEQKDYKKAEYHYKRSINKNLNAYDSIYGLSILYFYKMNKKDNAFKRLKYIIKKKPSYYRAKFALARFYYEEKEPAKSLLIYEALYEELKSKKSSKQMKEYLDKSRENLTRLQTELLKK